MSFWPRTLHVCWCGAVWGNTGSSVCPSCGAKADSDEDELVAPVAEVRITQKVEENE
jgi:hypothetical protein